jgi:hypothetical protein
MFIAL